MPLRQQLKQRKVSSTGQIMLTVKEMKKVFSPAITLQLTVMSVTKDSELGSPASDRFRVAQCTFITVLKFIQNYAHL